MQSSVERRKQAYLPKLVCLSGSVLAKEGHHVHIVEAVCEITDKMLEMAKACASNAFWTGGYRSHESYCDLS